MARLPWLVVVLTLLILLLPWAGPSALARAAEGAAPAVPLQASPAAGGPAAPGGLLVRPRTLNFGSAVESIVPYTATLILVNWSAAPLTITQVAVPWTTCTGCYAASAGALPAVLLPFATRTLTVSWWPVATGTYNLGVVAIVHSQGVTTARLVGWAIPF
jgi:hypothetical protein